MKYIQRISWVLLAALFIPLVADAATFSYGASTTYTSGGSSYVSVSKIDSTHVIVAYQGGSAGKARIGTIDGTGITFGSEYQFAATAQSVDVQLIDSTHALITYSTGANGYAVVATISGTTISYGTPSSFASDLMTGSRNSTLALLDSTHFVVEYITATGVFPAYDYNANVIAGTISGTTVTFGSPTALTSDNSAYYPYVSALDSTHALLLYGIDDGTGYAIALSVSGTTITLGSAVQYATSASDGSIAVLDSTHGIITYRNGDDSDKAHSLVATVSGTSVTLGASTAVTSGTTYYTNTEPLSSTTAILAYRDQSDSAKGKTRLLTVSAGTVSSDSASTFFGDDDLYQYMDIAALEASSAFIVSENQNVAIIATTDTTAPSAPTSFTATPSGSSVALTWTNPIDGDFLSNTIRRSTTSYPATSTGGSAVDSGLTGTSATDTGLADATYYYSIFARDLRGNYSTAAQATATVDTSAPATSTELPHQRSGGSRGNSTRLIIQSMERKMQAMQSHPAAPGEQTTVAKEAMSQSMQTRTCERVMKWFSTDVKMLGRVNGRLEKRFGFTCGN